MARDTKERILRETLFAFSSLRFEDISLAMIAKRVGVSKTAIFRHFKNKQELFDTLETQVLNQILVLRDQLLAIDKSALPETESRSKVFEVLALFFSEKPELLPYLIQRAFNSQSSVATTTLLEVFGTSDIRSVQKCFDMATMCFFLMQMVSDYPGDTAMIHQYADSVSLLIEHGFPCFGSITVQRMEELDSIAEVSAQETTQDRFFIALGRVLEQYSPLGISVERVAAELGLANSTLYATYANKETLIRQTVIKEFLNFGTVLTKRLACAQSLSEAIYVVLATSSSYCARSIPLSDCIISWICMNGKLDCNCDDFERVDFQPRQNPELDRFHEQFQEYCDQENVDSDLISRWVMFLPFSFCFMKRLCPEFYPSGYSDESLYRLIQRGVGGARSDTGDDEMRA